MATPITSLPIAGVVLVAALLVGCGPADETDRIALVPVQGIVTLDGRPLEGAEVVFTPDPSNPTSTPGGATSGPQGMYLAQFRGRSGLAPGRYQVIVNKSSIPSSPAQDGGEDPYMDQTGAESSTRKGGRKNGKPTPTTRGDFVREVPSRGGQLDLNLEARPRPR